MKPTTGDPLDIPERYEDVTAEWLTQALRAGGVLGEQTVSGFSIEPISAARSRNGSLARISVSYDGQSADLPKSLFAKFVSRIPANRERAADRDLFRTEIAMYANLGDMMPLNMPKMYFGFAKEGSDVAVILMEEIDGLSKAGLSVAEEWSLTKSEAFLALRELSGMHARWWGDESIGEYRWLLPVVCDRRRREYHIYEEGCIRLRDVIEPALSPPEIQICDRLSGFLPTLMSELDQMPTTLCHGDYHAGNLLWDELGEPSTVWAIDWQASAIGPAILDVSFLLGTSVTRNNLKFVRHDYLPEYHGALIDSGVNDYGYQRFLSDYRYGLLDVLQRVMGALAVVDFGRPDAAEVIHLLVGNLTAAAEDAGCGQLMS